MSKDVKVKSVAEIVLDHQKINDEKEVLIAEQREENLKMINDVEKQKIKNGDLEIEIEKQREAQILKIEEVVSE